jgi:hypothetical protein
VKTVINSSKFSLKALLHAALVVSYCICIPSLVIAAQQPELFNAVGLRELVETDPDLTGYGVRIAAVGRSASYTNNLPDGDYQADTHHLAFWEADIAFDGDAGTNAGYSKHETAIAGLMLGLDPNVFHSQVGSFDYHGACPDASVQAFEFWRFVSLYVFGGREFKSDILTLSLGDIFPCWWTRGIEKLASQKNLVVIAAAGNGRNSGDPVLYPAAGANVIAVGVVNAAVDPNTGSFRLDSFASANPSTSSSGPTADGRCKPDIVAPGRGLVPVINSEHDYAIEGNWSSLATPVVSGAVALLMQKAKSDPNLATALYASSNVNSAIKAILLTSADKLPFWHKGRPDSEDDDAAPLDYEQGAGMLNVMDAYRLLLSGSHHLGQVGNTGWDNNTLEPNQPDARYEFVLNDPNNKKITATLCWNRVYQDTYPYEPVFEKDLNLRLELWGIDPNHSQMDTLLSYSDSINDNVEHIHAAADLRFTHYRIIVRSNDNLQALQSYAIAWMIGIDKAADNPFWNDLNNDSKISDEDRLIYYLVDQNKTQWLETNNGSETLHIDPKRLQTLISQWHRWKPFISQWSSSSR